MNIKRTTWKTKLAVTGAALATLTTACGSGGGSSAAGSATQYGPTGPVASTGSKIQGGTATFAEGPSAPPTYIFPLVNAQNCSTMNAGQLSYLLYRPLYWYGNNNNPNIDYDYSIGQKPVFSNNNQTVTITLNNWKWSDGEQVTSRDVVFWMNLLKANKDNWCSYTPGLFPDNVTSVQDPNPTTVVFHLDKAYNPTWFLYNELSQVFPLPMAWDKTSLTGATPSATDTSAPDMTTAGATAVYKFLDKLSSNTATYANSPIWSIVDGPWKLTGFTNTGEVTFVPNSSYSGSPKPTIAKFVEVPFTDDQAMVNQIKAGGPSALSFAQLPDEDLPQLNAIKNQGYNVTNFTSFSYAFFPLNLNNPKFGPVFRQLYFRQAFQHLVDQQGWISKFLGGYGVPTYGPVPIAPPNSFVDKYESTDLYPFSIADAKQILTSHGWTVKANGVTTCTNPGSGANQCGAGVPQGLGLSFNLDYQSGSVVTKEQMQDLASQASQVGINLQLTQHPFAQVISKATQCKPTQPTCAWTAENWGAGWVYAPDYYPSGESLFETGAAANYENWSDSKADSLIAATTTTSQANAQAALDAYQNYIAQQVPVVFFPTASGNPTSAAPVLTSVHLGGVTNNVFTNLTPETWYLTK